MWIDFYVKPAKYSLRLLLILFIGLVFSAGAANSYEISVNAEDQGDRALYLEAGWLIDAGGNYSAAELASQLELFRPYSSFNLPVNPSRHGMWFHFTLHNPEAEPQDLVLSARESLSLADMRLYIIAKDGHIEKAAKQQPHQLTAYAIPLSVAPRSSTQYLVYWPAGIDQYPLETLRLSSMDTLQKNTARQLSIAYLTIGIIFGLTLYNIFLYFFTRETSYIYYTLFVAFSGVYFSMHDEVGHQFFSMILTSQDHQGKLLWWSIMPACLGLVLFSREFLETNLVLPGADRLLKVLLGTISLLILFGFFLQHELLRSATVILAIIIFCSLLWVGVVAWRRGKQQARLYVTAFMALFTMSFLAAVAHLLEKDLGKAAMYMEIARFGLIFSLILLSIALADRINVLKQQQVRSEADASAALEAADLKGQFLASMSHEIRTPINGVIGMAQIIRDNASNKQDANAADVLLSSADTLLNIVNDILDLSKIEADKLQINRESFELGLLFANVGALFFQTNKQSNVNFIVDLDGTLPDFLIGDQLRIKQVLYNLLGNAFKFTYEGEIKLSCYCIGSKAGEVQGIKFSVEDTGIGINSEDRERLFQPYVQVDKSSTRKNGGTGLGLSISKRLVELMGGEIGVESQVDKGSKFWFTLDFEIDEEKEQLLKEQRRQLKDKKIAICYASEIYGINEKKRLEYIGAKPTLHVVKDDVPDLGGAELVLTSDLLGKNLKGLIERCGEMRIPIVIAKANDGHYKDEWSALADVRLIYIPVTSIDIEVALIKSLSGEVLVAAEKDKAHEGKILPSKNVLVVEDNETNQVIIKSMLAKLNQNIKVVENGEQALDVYCNKDSDIDLILMDCEMPIMDGYEATSRIRDYENENNLASVHICALTAHALADNYQRCLRSGMDNVAIKPLKLENLRFMLSELARSSP